MRSNPKRKAPSLQLLGSTIPNPGPDEKITGLPAATQLSTPRNLVHLFSFASKHVFLPWDCDIYDLIVVWYPPVNFPRKWYTSTRRGVIYMGDGLVILWSFGYLSQPQPAKKKHDQLLAGPTNMAIKDLLHLLLSSKGKNRHVYFRDGAYPWVVGSWYMQVLVRMISIKGGQRCLKEERTDNLV